MKDKVLKLKSTVPQKIGKILLWTLVVFLLLRGIGSIFKQDETVTAQTLIDSFEKDSEAKKTIEFQGKAFAESFCLEYLTLNGRDTEGYLKRLVGYMQKDVDINMNILADVRTEAFSADGYKITWTSDNTFTVDVRARVKYFNVESSSSDQSPAQQTELMKDYQIKDVCLRIPVLEKAGHFQITGYPAFIPSEDKANVETKPYSGKEASEGTKEAILSVMESFFKIYYTGNPGEISYYMLDSTKQLKGLEGRYEFVSLDDITVYQNTESSYYVIVKLSIKDSTNGVTVPQQYKIDLVRKEDKYYIDKMNV
ncbi:conjugal transfer protein [Ruminiclostridium papyrosolvens]|uniref:conjugal transfer protein n=1 Tax=Ruminiclostridium papyrosolvens TaxID=29362 RepID=UPI00041A0CAA|nr:conjugal transfer protein [Ruminiclostridium papyrosolvens]